MISKSACYDDLRQYVESVPIVDCHNHTRPHSHKYDDPVDVVVSGNFYYIQDLTNSSSPAEVEFVTDASRSLDERWPVLEKLWKRSRHTGYAQLVRRVLKQFYDLDDLTLYGLKCIQGRLPNFHDEAVYDRVLGEAGIAARLEDAAPDMRTILDGTYNLPARGRLVARITGYHEVRNFDTVQARVAPLGRTATTLDEYVQALRDILTGCEKRGAVAVKDQSAYRRTLAYGNPTRAEAEAVFNWFMADPRRSAGHLEQVRPLDDYLFHELLRVARDLDLPVQIHTGLLGGSRQDIRNANAVNLTPVLELHQDVQFDLFHGNWPYDAELLFLAKNYANVRINMCWAHIIDPLYCQNLLRRAVSAVPHFKVHGYGSDFSGLVADYAWAHASIARDNIAIALSDLMDIQYLDMDEAKEIARGWLFDNPNAYYRLGL